jgi:DNA helicase IV
MQRRAVRDVAEYIGRQTCRAAVNVSNLIRDWKAYMAFNVRTEGPDKAEVTAKTCVGRP